MGIPLIRLGQGATSKKFTTILRRTLPMNAFPRPAYISAFAIIVNANSITFMPFCYKKNKTTQTKSVGRPTPFALDTAWDTFFSLKGISLYYSTTCLCKQSCRKDEMFFTWTSYGTGGLTTNFYITDNRSTRYWYKRSLTFER